MAGHDYSAGTLNLVQFQRWIGLHGVAIELHGSDEDIDLLHRVANFLDEYTSDSIDSAELLDALQTDPQVQQELAAYRAAVA